MQSLGTAIQLVPTTAYEVALSTLHTTSTTIRTTTVFKMAHGIPVQKVPLTIARLLPDPAMATYSEEWMTATGTRLSELNAERSSDSTGLADNTSTTAKYSTTTTTSFAETVSTPMPAPHELITTSDAVCPVATVPATTSVTYHTPAQETDDERTFAVSDAATADTLATMDAAEPSATTITTIAMPPPSPAQCFSFTSEVTASNTAIVSPEVVTAFTTSWLSLVTVSPAWATSQETTTTISTMTVSNQSSAASLETILDTSSPSVGTVEPPMSPTAAVVLSADTSSTAQASDVLIGDPLQDPAVSSTRKPFQESTSSAVLSITASNTVVIIDTATIIPSPTATLSTRNNLGHRPRALQSRYYQLNSPLIIWLSVSILLSILLWGLISDILTRRRESRELHLPIHR